ncbi:MAG: hypothetical protein ACD_7C00163G0005 [uncultured bacterium]|nr:MAG: hypothetical protein ACD_7C00163G0005 [uncultured bacterium]
MRLLIMVNAVVGSIAGSYIPLFWGGSVFSMTSLILSAMGGFLGIWLGYKMAGRMGL